MAHNRRSAGQHSCTGEPASSSARLGLPISGRCPGTRGELRLTLLGFPQIWLGDRILTFARRRAVALLVYLVVTRRPHSRESLVALLCDQGAGERARVQLRNALADLTSLLGDDLTVTRQTIAFDTNRPHWLDVAGFEGALDKAQAADDPGRLQSAVDLYLHEFLAGFALPGAPDFEEWQLLERERLADLLIRAHDLLIRQYVRSHDDAAALLCATRLLELDPWREETHRQMMRLLAWRGERSAALAQYEQCRRILADELGVEPLEETTALYDQLCRAGTTLPNNLPPPSTAFVGRSRELALLEASLADPARRLLTIVGIGGSGKTRLALQVAARYLTSLPVLAQDSFTDGVFYVALEGLADKPAPSGNGVGAADSIARTIAQALDIPSRSIGKPVEQLCEYLRPKRLLIVVDNIEHLRDGLAAIEAILLCAPHVKILVASRIRLEVDAEWVLELGGMDLPHDSADLEHADASVLFLQQAQQVQMTFEPSEQERDVIVRICSLLSGLPLAIVLATRQLHTTSCADIATALTNNIDYLTSTIRNLPIRQRSLRDSFQYSWSLLSQAEQQALRRLAVFKDDFSIEAARSVTRATPLQITKLVHASLVVPTTPGRCKIHDLARSYAVDLLYSHSDEEAHMQAQHAAYYAGLFAQHVAILNEMPGAIEAIRTDFANVCAAWDWVERSIRGDRAEQPHSASSLRAGQASGEAAVQVAPPLQARLEVARGRLLGQITPGY
jgi:DNA-binding SARP family transcriptional activator/predicted ATPase